jgi:hypothetical protein
MNVQIASSMNGDLAAIGGTHSYVLVLDQQK